MTRVLRVVVIIALALSGCGEDTEPGATPCRAEPPGPGLVVAVDPGGRVVWQTDVAATARRIGSVDGTVVVHDGTSAGVWALDLASGALTVVGATPPARSDRTPRLEMSRSDGGRRVVATDPMSRDVVWDTDVAGVARGFFDADTVVVTEVSREVRSALALDVSDGSIRWTVPLGVRTLEDVAVAGELILVLSIAGGADCA